jgi:hypothetical protein
MAGQYVTIINPGYSTLYTKDLPYLAGSGDVAGTNPLDPDDARALVEGEFLQLVDSSGKSRFTRGGNNAMSVSGTPDGEGTVPAFLYFQEKGRYDAQHTKLAHCIMGPSLFEFRTKLCYSTGLSVGDQVSVFDWDGPAGAFGVVRRCLAAYSAGWSVGRVSRIYGTNDIAVIFGLA